MTRLVEDSDTIRAQDVAKALSADQYTGAVLLEIVGTSVQQIIIVSTPGRYGGYIRWFSCPGCKRRVGKLYLPPFETAFLCRRCHRLNYRDQMSRQYRRNKNNPVDKRRRRQMDILKELEKVLRSNGLDLSSVQEVRMTTDISR